MTYPNALGFKSYVQISDKETTYGTAAAATSKMEIRPGDSCEIVPGAIDDDSLCNQRSIRSVDDGVQFYQGKTPFRPNYASRGLLQLLRAVYGTYAASTVETGVRDHAFSEGASPPSLTLQRITGDLPVGKCFRPLGAVGTGFTFEMVAGQRGSAEFNYTAQDQEQNITPTAALSFPLLTPILFRQANIVDDGSGDTLADLRIRGIKVTTAAPQTDVERAWLNTTGKIDQPLPKGAMLTTWEFTHEFKTLSMYNAARNRTVLSPNFMFRSPFSIGATSFYEYEMASDEAKLESYSDPVSEWGVLVAKSTYRTFNSGGTTAISIRVRNTELALA